jgi:hypothetical protein
MLDLQKEGNIYRSKIFEGIPIFLSICFPMDYIPFGTINIFVLNDIQFSTDNYSI